ncbi:MAG: HmuY family protein [Gemmatimonadaceae bacterium]|nr:HmuY family protein [Gemmatimonadaceae bacterium]
MRRLRSTLVATAALVTLAACGSDDDPTGPGTNNPAERVVNANQRVYLRLTSAGIEPVTVSDPATSTQWDLAVERTAVTLNGGSAGPGGVSGACLCVNQGLTLPELLALGRAPEPQRQRFDRITADSIPGDQARFVTDRFVAAAGAFFRGAPGASAVAEPDSAWMLRWGTVGGPLSSTRCSPRAGTPTSRRCARCRCRCRRRRSRTWTSTRTVSSPSRGRGTSPSIAGRCAPTAPPPARTR